MGVVAAVAVAAAVGVVVAVVGVLLEQAVQLSKTTSKRHKMILVLTIAS